jgi:hypothetical protein
MINSLRMHNDIDTLSLKKERTDGDDVFWRQRRNSPARGTALQERR